MLLIGLRINEGKAMAGRREQLEEDLSIIIDIDEPSQFRVLLHNDDYTPMDFVIKILRTVFHKQTEEATRIMLNVHQEGMGICGVFPYDIAETKVNRVQYEARDHGYPLRCTMEEA
jgi:ATP-dependent Clp protease adaptor protein ClpS